MTECACVYVCVYACMCVFVCVCVYVRSCMRSLTFEQRMCARVRDKGT